MGRKIYNVFFLMDDLAEKLAENRLWEETDLRFHLGGRRRCEEEKIVEEAQGRVTETDREP